MRSDKRPIWGWVLAGFFVLLIIVAVVKAIHRPPALPAVVLFPQGYTIPQQKAPIPERWIPSNWSWWWRLKQRIIGPPKTISLTISVLEFTAPPQNLLSSFALGE